ncbi:hypothetical protein ADL03_15960 [Nocardia sp. NRRL S-836]|nr:hypothetical protein ADL03_15960 [Nocardia sp. NRRL S-836]
MFDRKQAALEIIGALDNNDINDITGLGLRPPFYDEFADEIRDNLPAAYEPDTDTDDGGGEHDPTDGVSTVVDTIVPHDGGEVLRHFNYTDAAFTLPLSEVDFDPDKDVHAFLIGALTAAYEQGLSELIRHVEELVDEAEQEANEAELDDEIIDSEES